MMKKEPEEIEVVEEPKPPKKPREIVFDEDPMVGGMSKPESDPE